MKDKQKYISTNRVESPGNLPVCCLIKAFLHVTGMHVLKIEGISTPVLVLLSTPLKLRNIDVPCNHGQCSQAEIPATDTSIPRLLRKLTEGLLHSGGTLQPLTSSTSPGGDFFKVCLVSMFPKCLLGWAMKVTLQEEHPTHKCR